jgi:spore maturation protein CgeB
VRETNTVNVLTSKGVKLGEGRLKQALDYPKFKGPVRLLVLDTGYLVVRDLFDGAADLGWEVFSVPMKSKGEADSAFLADLLKALVHHRPDFIITMNHLGFDEKGILVGILADYKIPTASWFVDHPMPILGPAGINSSPFIQVFSFERTSLVWLSAHGYEDPVYLPTGANRRHFHPAMIDRELRETLSCSLSFAGNSWWTKARCEPEPSIRKAAEKAARRFRIDKHASLDGLESMLVRSFSGAPRDRYAVAQVLLAEASMQRRRDFARALNPLGIRIFGDPYWDKMAPGIDLVPFVDNERGLPALFSACSINANITAVQMPTAVNQRVWDVPAAGGFLLTDDQEDALMHFEENKEIAVYRTFEEAADKASYYLSNDRERAAFSACALDKIDKFHCLTHRLKVVGDKMKRRFG